MINKDILLIKKEIINKNVYALTFKCDDIAKIAKPGQFIHIYLPGYTLRRPFSICEIKKDGIKIVFNVRGKGTREMAKWQEGLSVNVIGPLGHGFSAIKNTDRVLLVGGGMGLAPLFELSKHKNVVKALAGFESENDIILSSYFEKYLNVTICTTDGSFGVKGLVTDFIKKTVSLNNINRIAACGPKAMLKVVANISREIKVFCEICMEERMACGIGACLGCHCNIILKDGSLQSAYVCKDGPVFDALSFCFD